MVLNSRKAVRSAGESGECEREGKRERVWMLQQAFHGHGERFRESGQCPSYPYHIL